MWVFLYKNSLIYFIVSISLSLGKILSKNISACPFWVALLLILISFPITVVPLYTSAHFT